MSEEFLMVRISKDKKQALKNRAFDLRLDGGMSQLVMALIDKELESNEKSTSAQSNPETIQQ